MALDMVGVQFDEAGDEDVAAHVLAGGGAFVEAGDHAVAQHHMAVDHRLRRDDAGIGEDGLVGHVRLLPKGGGTDGPNGRGTVRPAPAP